MANIGDLLIDKQMQLGLHTYTLHLWGLGQNWGVVADPRPKEMNLLQLMDKAVEWGLDGLHITGCDLETKDDTRLLEVKQAAASRNLYLEYNFSRNEEFDPRLTDRVEDGIGIAEKLGADLAKLSLDIRRPRPLYGSCFHPEVMRQLCDCHDEVTAVLPLLERTGIKLALENHTETFADEVLWLIDKIDHPLVGAASIRSIPWACWKTRKRSSKSSPHTLFATTSATTSSTGTSSVSGSTGSPWGTETSTASKLTRPSGNCLRPTGLPLKSSGIWAQTPWKWLGKKRWMPASGASNTPVMCSRLEVSDMRLFRNNQTPASRNATSYD
jgi:hypothetical protein